MRAERKARNRIKNYGDGVRAFLRWCQANGVTSLTRAQAQAWVADMLDSGLEPATARSRLKGLRRFCVWLVAEGELADDPLTGMRSPTLDTKVVSALSDEQCKRLLKACSWTQLNDRRDEAVIRFMLKTGARAAEVVGLQTADLELARGQVVIPRARAVKVAWSPSARRRVALDR